MRTVTAPASDTLRSVGRSRLAASAAAHRTPVTESHRFDRYELSLTTRQLLVDGRPVSLGARTFDLLRVLFENRDRVLCKDELLQRVWHGLVVEENNLQVHVSKLRRLFGSGAIATVRGLGYRFTLEPIPARPTAAPPMPRTRSNLPAPLSSLIGRVEDLHRLGSLVEEARLMTLTGIAGVGKSRLAVEFATRVAGEYPDGVWLVDLASLTNGAQVAVAAAETLGVPIGRDVPVLDAIVRHNARCRLLLILDNCEHVLPDCAQFARRLLQSTAGVKLLITSREPLHLPGEIVYGVPALAAPRTGDAVDLESLQRCSSVALFVDRAVAAQPAFALTNANARAVARICRDLDGLPLALELAAARMRAMSVNAIVDHLSDRFRLLKGSDATALSRHQTLHAAIGWSFDLLSPAERALLRRLAVFAGTFSIDGAEAVGAGPGVAAADVVDLLGRLVEKSVVAFEADATQYRILTTVRQYALERLTESGEESATRDALARHCERPAIDARPAIAGSGQA